MKLLNLTHWTFNLNEFESFSWRLCTWTLFRESEFDFSSTPTRKLLIMKAKPSCYMTQMTFHCKVITFHTLLMLLVCAVVIRHRFILLACCLMQKHVTFCLQPSPGLCGECYISDGTQFEQCVDGHRVWSSLHSVCPTLFNKQREL